VNSDGYYYYYYYYYYYLLYFGIYNHTTETNNVSKVCNIAVALCSRYMVRAMLHNVINVLYFYINSFRIMYAVPNVAVFSSSLMWFAAVLLGDFLNDFEMVPVVPFVFGVTFVFYILHALCVCCKIFIFRPLSWSRLCLQKLHYLLTGMFLFHYYGLWCPVFREG
jgi:hypothetical protein